MKNTDKIEAVLSLLMAAAIPLIFMVFEPISQKTMAKAIEGMPVMQGQSVDVEKELNKQAK